MLPTRDGSVSLIALNSSALCPAGPAESSPSTLCRVGWPVAGKEGWQRKGGDTGAERSVRCAKCFSGAHTRCCLLPHLRCDWVSVCLVFSWARSLLRGRGCCGHLCLQHLCQLINACGYVRGITHSHGSSRRAGTCVSRVNCSITST